MDEPMGRVVNMVWASVDDEPAPSAATAFNIASVENVGVHVVTAGYVNIPPVTDEQEPPTVVVGHPVARFVVSTQGLQMLAEQINNVLQREAS